MIKDHVQKQEGGDNSTNLQAKNITINHGLSYADARDIALDIYHSNFIKLSESAASVASERAISFSEKFLTELYKNSPDTAVSFETPALQSALYNAQKEYAKSGEQFLSDTLCNLLIERAKGNDRGIKQLAIEEAINIAPKLTSTQLDILSLNYLVQDGYYYINSTIGLEGFVNWMMSFVVKIEFGSPEISHLEFTGCAKIPSKSYGTQFPQNILNTFPGLFTKGFSVDEYKEAFGSEERYMGLITESEEDENKVRFKFRTIEGLKEYSGGSEFTKEERIKIVNFLKKGRLNTNELKERFMCICPESEFLFENYISDVYRLEASPVGTAIALSNIKRKINLALPWPYRMRSA